MQQWWCLIKESDFLPDCGFDALFCAKFPPHPSLHVYLSTTSWWVQLNDWLADANVAPLTSEPLAPTPLCPRWTCGVTWMYVCPLVPASMCWRFFMDNNHIWTNYRDPSQRHDRPTPSEYNKSLNNVCWILMTFKWWNVLTTTSQTLKSACIFRNIFTF